MEQCPFFFLYAIVNSVVEISILYDFVSFTGMINIIKLLECGLLGMMRFVIVITYSLVLLVVRSIKFHCYMDIHLYCIACFLICYYLI